MVCIGMSGQGKKEKSKQRGEPHEQYRRKEREKKKG